MGHGSDFLVVQGFCQICEAEAVFRSKNNWLRDFFLCENCHSIPRERAMIFALNLYYPNWRTLKIHESSPVDRGASSKIRRECQNYLASSFDDGIPLGVFNPGQNSRNEDLEKQTFPNDSFDLVLTQDVFEHLFRPDAAIREIARTLRPGGAHICTVPIVRKEQPSRRRASLEHGCVVHYEPPEYHGNPISSDGSLVTIDWGYDITEYLDQKSGLKSTIVFADNLHLGLRAEYLEVVVCRKLTAPVI
jgi:SAM-dependent methyltransferase